MMKIAFFIVCYLLFFQNVCFASSAIRDTESESIFLKLVGPLLSAAEVESKSFKIWIVDDPSINAYVSDDASIFITRGMIEFSDDPYVVSGVVAHEIGHILAHHITNRYVELDRILKYVGLGYLLGIITAFSVSPEAGAAIMMAGQGAGESAFMGYSRLQETVADQYALQLLDKVRYKNFGLKKLLEYFASIDLTNNYYRYFATHPPSRDRLFDVNAYIPKHKAREFSPELIASYKRMRAKILAYFGVLLPTAKCDLTSIECRYIAVMSSYRESDAKKALKLLDKLIVDYPQDPYFYELKGQILYKIGDMVAAISAYEIALKNLDYDNFLIKFEMSKAMNYVDSIVAAKLLQELLDRDYGNVALWYELSVAYEKSSNKGMMHLALAFKYFYEGDSERMLREARAAINLLPNDDKNKLKIEDLIQLYKMSN